jgi:hypothetical protein
MKSKNTNVPLSQNSFIDCGESLKLEDVKEEKQEEESIDDPLSIHQRIENSNICEDIKKEIKEEKNVDDPLTIHQEIENSNVCIMLKRNTSIIYDYRQ